MLIRFSDLGLTESLDVAALVAYLTTAIVITGLLSRVQRSVDELRCSEARLRKTNEDLRLEISERKQAQEALRISEQRRLAQLARANEALRGLSTRWPRSQSWMIFSAK